MSRKDEDIVLRVRGLSKMFKVYAHPRDLFLEAVFGRESHQENWALNDVSFDLRRGDILGVVGSNGAGKSTLLKLIVGTLDKTAGTVETEGKISAILELGTSFNPEFTGRENVRLGLVYAGFSRKEIKKKMDEVIAFSELRSVIDHPFKTYSTGMQARLTFSAAISTTTDLIIIDEALAAGDANFLGKALRHLKELSSQSHVSAIFVSHSMPTLMQLCNRGMYLREGEVVQMGSMEEIARYYETTMIADDEKFLHEKQKAEGDEGDDFLKDSPYKIMDTEFLNNGEPSVFFYTGEDAEISIYFSCKTNFENVWVGLQIFSSTDGTYVTMVGNRNTRTGDYRKLVHKPIDIPAGEGKLTFSLSPLLLGAGGYYFNFLLFEYDKWIEKQFLPRDAILYHRNADTFRVKTRDNYAFDHEVLALLPSDVSIKGIERSN